LQRIHALTLLINCLFSGEIEGERALPVGFEKRLNNARPDPVEFLGLDGDEFEKALLSAETESQLQQHLGLVQQLRVSGFPALFYVNDNNEAFALALGFCEAGGLEERFYKCKNNIA
jgi:hypothetical protein